MEKMEKDWRAPCCADNSVAVPLEEIGYNLSIVMAAPHERILVHHQG
jgi:hypothetical protein